MNNFTLGAIAGVVATFLGIYLSIVIWINVPKIIFKLKCNTPSEVNTTPEGDFKFKIVFIAFHTYMTAYHPFIFKYCRNITMFVFYIWSLVIVYHYGGGWCYYYAIIMKDSLGYGNVYWLAPYAHFVWSNEDGIYYDSKGMHKIESNECLIPMELIPEKFMGLYKHNINDEMYEKSIKDEQTEVFRGIYLDFIQSNNIDFNEECYNSILHQDISNRNNKRK